MRRLYPIFTILVFLTNTLLFQAQVKLIYNVKYRPDTLSEKYQEELMGLIIEKKESIFYNETKFRLDSLYDVATLNFERTGIVPNINIRNDFNIGSILDKEKDKMYLLKSVSRTMYQFPDEKFDQWKIDNTQKKEILGYECHKAEGYFGGRNWVAWYAPEIPIPEGPYRFVGLAGLILEVEDIEGDYTFSAVSIEKISEKTKIRKIETKNITREEYNKLVNKFIEDPAMSVRASIVPNVVVKGSDGRTVTNKEIFERIINEFRNFQKTHNNPIERNTFWVK